jgi:hypothetical protein
MKPFTTSILAGLAGAALVAGCVVTPVAGSYGYGYDRYDYDRPYYHDYGYYDSWPGYYGGPAVYGSFRFGNHDHHWGGGSWQHNSLTSQSDRSRPHAARSHNARGSSHNGTPGTRARAIRHAQRPESDRS